MKAKTAVVVLTLLLLALGVAFYWQHQRAAERQRLDEAKILQLSDEWKQTSEKLAEQIKVNITLETNLFARTEEVKYFSNQLVQLRASLEETEAEAKATAERLQTEISRRDVRIASLESERDDLSTRMTDLNVSITTLESQISETQRKLAASEGDREFLLTELKRLQSEKAELERQFNDLVVLREQVRKLRDELSFAKRIELIRRGLYGRDQKGGQRMQQSIVQETVKTNFDLNVEITSDGAVRVVPPTTNAPALK